jgi:DNA polymerase (family X)
LLSVPVRLRGVCRADVSYRVGGGEAGEVPRPSNGTIADQLALFAALLDVAGASTFSSRAYRRAADVIREAPVSVADLVRAGRARDLRGIGPGIELRLLELVETGRIAELAELESEIAPDVVGLGQLLGLSTQRTLDIAHALNIRSAEEFRAAIESGLLCSVPGIGPARDARIRANLAQGPAIRRGLTLNRSRLLTQAIASVIAGEPAGDPRRYCELSFGLAVVCAADDKSDVLRRFERQAQIVTIIERSEQRAVGVTVEGVPITAVVAEPARFGTELIRWTGSAPYVESLGPLPDGADEASVFAALGLPWRPPELRELPLEPVPGDLIERADVRGDLHCHTTWSDGKATVEEMGAAARELGHEYLAVCDHTPNVRVVAGLSSDELQRQGEEIEQANERLRPFRLLRGVECDILPDGSLDLDDAVLSELDWVQISLHAGQRRPGRELTHIVCEAMRNPHVKALSHPKGRILNHRPENELDLDAVFEVAVETGVALEINGLPDRLDLSSVNARKAIRAGVRLVLSSDAHSPRGLSNLDLSVGVARRAGATVADIVNTAPQAQLLT